jgi:glycine C-acetyltransferase
MSSVRFICGTQDIHLELERKMAKFLGMEEAIIFSSCFDANLALFEGLLTPEDAIYSDKLVHASIIDGIRLCKAQRFIYEHSNMKDLEEKLQDPNPPWTVISQSLIR